MAPPAKIMARAFVDGCQREMIRQQEGTGAYRAEKQLIWEMGNLTEADRHILFPFKDTGPAHSNFSFLNTVHPTTDKGCFLNIIQVRFRQTYSVPVHGDLLSLRNLLRVGNADSDTIDGPPLERTPNVYQGSTQDTQQAETEAVSGPLEDAAFEVKTEGR